MIMNKINYNSLSMMILFINEECGGFESPIIETDSNGIFYISWYGKNGHLTLKFDKNTEYNFISYNGKIERGVVDNNFTSLRKKTGVKYLYEVTILDKEK